MDNCTLEKVAFFGRIGFEQVVLACELMLEEIREIVAHAPNVTVRIIIIMAISPIYILIAQEVAEYNAKISKVFQHVDKSRVTTGLLYDYGLHLIDPVYYDGVALTDENYIDMEIWNALYGGMYSSKVNGNISLPTPDQMNARISSERATSLAVIHLRYDMYRKDAIGSSSVKVVNEQIYDVNNKNPYEQKILFAIAPKEKYYHDKTIRFKFSSNLFVKDNDS